MEVLKSKIVLSPQGSPCSKHARHHTIKVSSSPNTRPQTTRRNMTTLNSNTTNLSLTRKETNEPVRQFAAQGIGLTLRPVSSLPNHHSGNLHHQKKLTGRRLLNVFRMQKLK